MSTTVYLLGWSHFRFKCSTGLKKKKHQNWCHYERLAIASAVQTKLSFFITNLTVNARGTDSNLDLIAELFTSRTSDRFRRRATHMNNFTTQQSRRSDQLVGAVGQRRVAPWVLGCWGDVRVSFLEAEVAEGNVHGTHLLESFRPDDRPENPSRRTAVSGEFISSGWEQRNWRLPKVPGRTRMPSNKAQSFKQTVTVYYSSLDIDDLYDHVRKIAELRVYRYEIDASDVFTDRAMLTDSRFHVTETTSEVIVELDWYRASERRNWVGRMHNNQLITNQPLVGFVRDWDWFGLRSFFDFKENHEGRGRLETSRRRVG
jgi:hypothetical protein